MTDRAPLLDFQPSATKVHPFPSHCLPHGEAARGPIPFSHHVPD